MLPSCFKARCYAYDKVKNSIKSNFDEKGVLYPSHNYIFNESFTTNRQPHIQNKILKQDILYEKLPHLLKMKTIKHYC